MPSKRLLALMDKEEKTESKAERKREAKKPIKPAKKGMNFKNMLKGKK